MPTLIFDRMPDIRPIPNCFLLMRFEARSPTVLHPPASSPILFLVRLECSELRMLGVCFVPIQPIIYIVFPYRIHIYPTDRKQCSAQTINEFGRKKCERVKATIFHSLFNHSSEGVGLIYPPFFNKIFHSPNSDFSGVF